MKKSPVGSWRSFFNLGKSSSVSKRKLQRNESEPSEMKAMALKGQCPPAVPELPLGEGGRSVHTCFTPFGRLFLTLGVGSVCGSAVLPWGVPELCCYM